MMNERMSGLPEGDRGMLDKNDTTSSSGEEEEEKTNMALNGVISGGASVYGGRSIGSARPVTTTARLGVQNRMRIKRMTKFWELKLIQLLCVVYILIFTFSYAGALGPYGGLVDPNTGNIIDPNSEQRTKEGVILVNGSLRPVVAQGWLELLCLAVSRSSAFSMYPVIIMVFFSKCKSLMAFLGKSPLLMWMYDDMHELHVYCGGYIAVDSCVHTLFHCFRWIAQGNIHLLWTNRTGLSGVFGVLATLFVAFPMMHLKRTIPYEYRKLLHYLFYVFAIALCYHVPLSGLPNGGFISIVLGACITVYTLDALYIYFFMTEKIETTLFHKLPSGVQMTMAVSERFQKRGEQGGYAYVCLPWVTRSEWHAFSLFENPVNASERQVFMLKTGDWTEQVHNALQRSTVRPVWVQGPFPSPYNNAESYDNQVMVASGIGITPALSVIRAHKDSRRTNLIWAVRDVAMLEFFLEHLYLDHTGWNLIFYTGHAPLNPALEDLNSNVKIIKRRPNLDVIIPNIIYGIESGVGVPERYIPSAQAEVKKQLASYVHALDNTNLTTNEKLIELTALAQNQGFLFTDLVNDMEEDEAARRRDIGGLSPKTPVSSRDLDFVEDPQRRDMFPPLDEEAERSISGASQRSGMSRGHSIAGSITEGMKRRVSEKFSRRRASLEAAISNEQQESQDLGISQGSLPLGMSIPPASADGEAVLQLFRNYHNHESSRTLGSVAGSDVFIDATDKNDDSLDERRSSVDSNGHLSVNSSSGNLSTGKRVSVESKGFSVSSQGLSINSQRHSLGSSRHLGVSQRDSIGQNDQAFGQNKAPRDRDALIYQSIRQNLGPSGASGMLGGGGLGAGTLTMSFTPWEENDSAKSFVKGLDKSSILSTWGILYCGGSKPVEDALRRISLEYDVALNTESFAW